jgi:hypothetical protein
MSRAPRPRPRPVECCLCRNHIHGSGYSATPMATGRVCEPCRDLRVKPLRRRLKRIGELEP